MRAKATSLWSLDPQQMSDSSPVSMVKACRLNKTSSQSKKQGEREGNSLERLADGDEEVTHDLIVARDNGRVEIYSY